MSRLERWVILPRSHWIGDRVRRYRTAAHALIQHTDTVVLIAMGKRLLIVDPAETATESVARCRVIGIEPVLFPEAVAGAANADAMLAAAKAARVDGVWAASPKRWSQTQWLAAELGMPLPPQVALEELLVRGRWVQSNAAAAAACDAFGVPVWVRAEGDTGIDWCMRVDHAADTVLAFRRARRKGGDGRAFVQPALVGDTFRVVGYMLEHDFNPVAIFRESYVDGAFRVIASCTVGVAGSVHAEVAQAARNVCSRLEKGRGLTEVEIVVDGSEETVVHVRAARGIDPVHRVLVQMALGVDLLDEALRVAVGEAPRVLPSRTVGASACWLTARTGVIEAVAGVDAAQQLEGVKAVVVNAQVGDTVRHLEDRAGRDRLGYVVAAGATADVALRTAEAACAMVDVDTRAALD